MITGLTGFCFPLFLGTSIEICKYCTTTMGFIAFVRRCLQVPTQASPECNAACRASGCPFCFPWVAGHGWVICQNCIASTCITYVCEHILIVGKDVYINSEP